MKKAVEGLLALLGKLIFAGLSIQTVLGIGWMCLNFANLQEFGESAFYLQVSGTLICDEYTGILYPVFLLLTEGVERVVGIPFYQIVYAVQLSAALYAGWSIFGCFRKTGKWMRIRGSLGLLTAPMAMQCHLAVLPCSLAGSFFLLEISAVLALVRSKEERDWKQFLRALVFWLLCILLLPEYLWIGAVPVLFALVYALFAFIRARDGRRRAALRLGAYGACVAAALGLAAGVGGLTRVRGYYGRTEKSPEAAMVSRFAWTSLEKYYGEWPEEIRRAVDLGKMRESAYYPDNMERVFGPLLEQAFGKEGAKKCFRQLSEMAWEKNKRKIIHETAWDAVGYGVSPIVLQLQLTGRGYDAYSGRNYEIMRNHTPVLTRIYMDYSCWWFGAGLGICCVMQLLYILKFLCFGKKAETLYPGRTLLSLILLLSSCGGMILWYTMRGAGMMDYKLTIAVGSVWSLWSLVLGTDAAAGGRIEGKRCGDEGK